MANDPIPLPANWWVSQQYSALDYANAMIAAHFKEFNDLFAAINHPLVTDAGTNEEGTANENDAFYAGDSLYYARTTLTDIVTNMTTGWTSSGAGTWKGPAATTFTNLFHALHTYVNDLLSAALEYGNASTNAAFAHQKAKSDLHNLLDNFLHHSSTVPAAVENKVFHPARQFAATKAVLAQKGYYSAAYYWWAKQFVIGYNWLDTAYVLSYTDISKAGFEHIWPTLSSVYGESYLGLPVVPEANFPVVDKKLDPYAAEKEDLKKAKDVLDKQKDDLDKAQANAQDQLNAQQKNLADEAAAQQAALEKQQGAAQDQMNAQQKQLADDAAKQQDALANMPGGPTDPGAPMDAGTPNMPGGGQPPPNDVPALDPAGAAPAGMPTDVPVPGGAAPTAVVAGPNGALGLDTTGDGVMNVPLPAGAAVVPKAGGGSAVDVNGDGTADVDMAGNAVAGGSAPPGSRLVTGADGQVGYDINGDGVADLDLDGNALPGGVLPAGSRFVTGPDGRQGFDMDGNGIPDTDPRGVPLPNSAYFNNPPAGPPDAVPPPAGLNPGNQVQLPPAGPVAGPPGALAPTVAGAAMGGAAEAAAQGGGYPPMYPPMGGGGMGQNQNDKNERERQTWLQEEEDVWEGDMVAVAAAAQLGRPVEDEELPEDWEEPVRPPSRTTPRQPRPGQYPTGTRR